MNPWIRRSAAVAALLFWGGAAHARSLSYAEALDQALKAMEAGRHPQALAPLRTALTLDRNELSGLLALGTLYLHTGSPTRARAEFERARIVAPGHPLVAFAMALTALATGKRDAAAFDALPASAIPVAPTVAAYVRLMSGDFANVRARLADVTETEPDLLRLEIAAFTALRAGDAATGETLLRALLLRDTMKRLAEDAALTLPFERHPLAEASAPPLPTALGFPAPLAGTGSTLTGRVTLSPGNLPNDVAYVSYSISGGLYSATTNYAPFAQDCNTTRLPNGLHTLKMTAYSAGGRIVREWTRTVNIANQNAPRSRSLTEQQAAQAHDRLLALLTPRPSRKAAHFALAERATARGDGETALRHIEAVVAIDPTFRNARASLRRYNHAVLGPRNGIWRANTAKKLIALTFDDGPNPQRTPLLLDALQSAGAKATFFVVGLRVEQTPKLLGRMVREGHEVANHTYSHQNLALLTPASMERELCRTSVLIREATGIRPRFYRPPGGNFDHRVRDAAEAMGMSGAYWTVAATKHEEAASARMLTQYVLAQAKPGAIILLHNAPDVTVKAVPGIVRGLRARGYELVTMTELVRRSKGAAPIAKRPARRSASGG